MKTHNLGLASLALSLFCAPTVAIGVSSDPNLQQASSLDEKRETIDLSHYLYTEKLDGVRGYWDGRKLMTRTGKPIHAPAWFLSALPEIAVEGELWIGRGQFERVSGIVRTNEPNDENWRDVTFWLFDLPHYPGDYKTRKQFLDQTVTRINVPFIRAVNVKPFTSDLQLQRDWQLWQKQGAEGVMLYKEDALYLPGRGTALLKLKGYEDAEATVIEILEGKGKYRGMMGALLVESANGVRFKVGSGFTDEQRKTPPAIGSQITYRYNGLTRNGLPRFARFERLRPEE
ncbi:DNA ligase [Neptunomonas concharum]|uniref:DNA ligase n=1 Tax=Neptunomonas concharum TaxID=1031538 RepID=A0A5P1RA08_9GAMM|nr:DNA ligase [Neptunomonas concharum]QEQ96116.1 DNA ligase [Neptunomonas concharum]